MTAAASGLPTPYADAALTYREAGWLGVLPVPARSKKLKVEGWTGRDGLDPSGADVYEWRERHRHSNIALRMPDTVIGLDIDAYKPEGVATIERWVAESGPLPLTWRSTARDDGTSGIYWFKVPAGLEFAGQLGPGVEIIQRSHRYAMVPPSVHPEGWTYRWYEPTGAVSLAFPGPDSFPVLPAAWLDRLVRVNLDGLGKADITIDEAWAWLAALPHASDEPCRMVQGEADRTIKDFGSGESRHDLLNDASLKILRYGVNGHAGVLTALEELREEFVASVTTSGEIRTTAEGNAEWRRAVDGAVRLVRANEPEIQPWCVCRPPFHPSLVEEAQRRRAAVGESVSSWAADPPSRTEGVTSWVAVDDWAEAMAGTLGGIVPAQLARTDGTPVWYPGKINGLLGPSESGKSWVALLAVFQAVRVRAEHVIILDFEDDQIGTAERLLALGLTPAECVAHITYVRPDEPLTPDNKRALMEMVARLNPSLIILDGLNAAMTLLGLDLLDNRDCTTFYQQLLAPLANTGATVGYIDHTPKNDAEVTSKGGIGAQAKRAMTTGAAIRAEVLEPFDREHEGRLRLTVDKDRAGHVRRAADKGVIGLVKFKPGGDGALSIRFDAVAGDLVGFDPMMARAAKALSVLGPSSQRAVEREVGAKVARVRDALADLVDQGYVATTPGARGAVIHTLIKAYNPSASTASGLSGDSVGVSASPSLDGTHTHSLRNAEEQDALPDPADDPAAE